MNCPKCQERLHSEYYSKNQYLICFYCEGAWVKKSELGGELVIEQPQATKLPCPSCDNTTLQHVKAAGLELEYCQICEGVFFDKGELEALYPSYKGMDGKKAASDTAEALTFLYIISKALSNLFKIVVR